MTPRALAAVAGLALALPAAARAQRPAAPEPTPRDRARVSMGFTASVSTAIAPETPADRIGVSAAAGVALVLRPSGRLVVEATLDGYTRVGEQTFLKGASAPQVARVVTYEPEPRNFAATALRAGLETRPRAVRLRLTGGGGWMWHVGTPYATTAATMVVGTGWIRGTLAADGWWYALPRVERETEYDARRRPVRVLSERRSREPRGAVALRLGAELPFGEP